jgi:hypothetical protein
MRWASRRRRQYSSPFPSRHSGPTVFTLPPTSDACPISVAGISAPMRARGAPATAGPKASLLPPSAAHSSAGVASPQSHVPPSPQARSSCLPSLQPPVAAPQRGRPGFTPRRQRGRRAGAPVPPSGPLAPPFLRRPPPPLPAPSPQVVVVLELCDAQLPLQLRQPRRLAGRRRRAVAEFGVADAVVGAEGGTETPAEADADAAAAAWGEGGGAGGGRGESVGRAAQRGGGAGRFRAGAPRRSSGAGTRGDARARRSVRRALAYAQAAEADGAAWLGGSGAAGEGRGGLARALAPASTGAARFHAACAAGGTVANPARCAVERRAHLQSPSPRQSRSRLRSLRVGARAVRRAFRRGLTQQPS